MTNNNSKENETNNADTAAVSLKISIDELTSLHPLPSFPGEFHIRSLRTKGLPFQRDELDGIEMAYLADFLKEHGTAEHAELEQKLRRLSERYITTGR